MTFIPGREDEENDEREGGRRLSRGANSAQPPNSSFGACRAGKGGPRPVTLRVQVPFFTLTEGKKEGLTIRLVEKRKSSLSNAGSGQGGQGLGKGFQRAALS